MSTAARSRPDVLDPVSGLLGLGVLAAVADAALTWFAMQVAAVHGNLVFTELNPAVRGLIHKFGGVPAMGARIAFGMLVLGFLAWAARYSRWGWRPLAAATMLTWAVVTWNVGMLYIVVL